MYAWICETGRGFFAGVRWQRDWPLTCRDPPPLPCHSRMVLCQHSVWEFSLQRIFIHRSYIFLCLAITHGAKNGLFFARIGEGLCTILDMEFREFVFFQALG